MYVMDTDHLSILQRRTAPHFVHLSSRLRACSAADVYRTIISFHEQVSGWNAHLNRARTQSAVVRAYERYERMIAEYAGSNVLSFDDDASALFDALRRRRVRIGTMDLRIASICLANDMTLLSSNLRDFARVPGLRVEDWTVAPSP